MPQIHASILIRQPVEQVFQFAWDPSTIRQWIPEATESVPMASSETKMHTRVHGPAGLVLELIQETVEFTPNHRYISRTREVHGWIVSQSYWDFESAAEGSRVSVQHEVELHGWLRWLAPIVLWGARKKVQDDLLRLKTCLEGAIQA